MSYFPDIHKCDSVSIYYDLANRLEFEKQIQLLF